MNDSGIVATQPGRAHCVRGFVRKLRRSDAGQALVEFSLVLPVMLLMLFALVDFGRGFYSWLIITNAAREGARVGATQVDATTIRTRVTAAAAGIDNTDLTVTLGNVQGARGQAITVDLSYQFAYVTPIGGILTLLGGSTLATPVISAHSSMRLE